MNKNITTKSNKNSTLFNKYSGVTSSPIYICYLILKEYSVMPKKLKTDKKISIYRVFNDIKKIDAKIPSDQIYLSLILMNSLGLASFERPYLIIKKHD